jgi:Domain of unknown function (DUF4258)
MIRLTKHAQEAIIKRDIAALWIEAAVNTPDSVEADPRHPDRLRSYKAIPELGGRILRVVHRLDGNDIIVITAHLDRGAKR